MHYLSNRKHFAVRYLLYGYRHNVILYENYISTLKEADTVINTEFIKQDFIRIQENIHFIESNNYQQWNGHLYMMFFCLEIRYCMKK